MLQFHLRHINSFGIVAISIWFTYIFWSNVPYCKEITLNIKAAILVMKLNVPIIACVIIK